MDITDRPGTDKRGGLRRRLGWFAAIWLASVAALAVVAWAIRWVLLGN